MQSHLKWFGNGMRVKELPWGLILLLTCCSVSPAAGANAREDAFVKCKRAQGALEKIEMCSVVILKSKDPKILERAFNRRGLAYMEVNEFGAAVSDFTALVQLNPKIAGYFDNRQRAFQALGKLADALQDANVAVRLAPTYSFVYRNRGIVFDAMNRYSDAIADYNKAIGIELNNFGLYIERGKIFAKISRLNEAIEDFSRAISIDSKAIVALRERGLAFTQQSVI
jgi:tetratricopeptide (TPR) repeat protein